MIETRWLGRADYEPVLAQQLAERERVWAGGPGVVLLCEHPPVITLGRSANRANVLAAGYRDIEWIKRVGGIAYATTTAPGISRMILISARSGDQPIDRRGIGELRVGVEAKDLVAGILFSATELSEDAERELERAGRSINVVCGDQLVATLISAGVGVVSSAAPLHYLDDQLLDEILAG